MYYFKGRSGCDNNFFLQKNQSYSLYFDRWLSVEC